MSRVKSFTSPGLIFIHNFGTSAVQVNLPNEHSLTKRLWPLLMQRIYWLGGCCSLLYSRWGSGGLLFGSLHLYIELNDYK